MLQSNFFFSIKLSYIFTKAEVYGDELRRQQMLSMFLSAKLIVNISVYYQGPT